MGDALMPGPSNTSFSRLGKAGENYARLCQFIVTICSDVFRDVLSRSVRPANLRATLDNAKEKLCKHIHPQQMTLLYPNTPSTSSIQIKSKDFDLSLLYTIIRNVCNIPVHSLGWGNSPEPGDYCLSACIERIRIERNAVMGHLRTGAIDDQEFIVHWNELKESVLSIERELTGAGMYERWIEELYRCNLNPSTSEKYIAEFAAIKEAVSLKRERIEELEAASHDMEAQIKVKKENLDTQDIRLQKLECEIASFKKQQKEQEERIKKHITEKIMEQEKRLMHRLSDHKQTLRSNENMHIKVKLTGTFTNVTEFQLTYICSNISCVKSDKAWISDYSGRLVLVNVKGEILKERKNAGHTGTGGHCVTLNGELLLADKSCVKRITLYNEEKTIINTGDFQPICIHSSFLSDDILIGMTNGPVNNNLSLDDVEMKVTRYNAEGEELQQIISENSTTVSVYPYFITENINGDICTILGAGLKVVDKSGNNRFTYAGRESSENIRGQITTDALGHIFVPVSDRFASYINRVDMLNQDGTFVCSLLQNVLSVQVSLSIDNLHRLWLADGTKVTIYQYLDQEK